MKKIILLLFQCFVSTFDYNNTTSFLSFIEIKKNANINYTQNFSIYHQIENNAYNLNKNSSYINKNSTFIKKNNLIIGSFINYDWSIIQPFFSSFKKAQFNNCICVMFVSNISQDTLNKVESLGIIVYSIPDKFKNLKLINYRWKIYEDFINENRDKYNIVFTADIRDVLFQNDLFKFYENNKSFLGVAIEDGILSEFVNKNWLINAYGENLYKTIKNERIICVGTIWGTPDRFCEFCNIMWDKLNSDWSLKNDVIEQAVANYLIYHDKMFNDCLIKSDNNNGPIMTIGLTKRVHIKLDSKKNILNGKREIASVIHQYDRKKDISNNVINKYCHEKNYIKNGNINNFNENKLFLKYDIFFIISLTSLMIIKIYLFLNNNSKNLNKKKVNF